MLQNQLYFATITKPAQIYSLNSNPKCDDYELWHARLGHPGNSMTRRMVEQIKDLKITAKDVSNKASLTCLPCIKGKFKIAPSYSKTRFKRPEFMEMLFMDICGPINPPCGPFRYFQVVVEATGRYEITKLLSSKNQAFPRLLTQLIQLKNQYPDNKIKEIRTDNASEYSSTLFDKYCETQGIVVQHSVEYQHFQNGLAELTIKKLQLIY